VLTEDRVRRWQALTGEPAKFPIAPFGSPDARTQPEENRAGYFTGTCATVPVNVLFQLSTISKIESSDFFVILLISNDDTHSSLPSCEGVSALSIPS
jgi:hypothetical protein